MSYPPRPGTLTVAAKSELVTSFTSDHEFGEQGTYKGVLVSASANNAVLVCRFYGDASDRSIPLSTGLHSLPWWLTHVRSTGTTGISYVLGYLE